MQRMNHVVLVFLAAVNVGQCLLSGGSDKSTASVPDGHVSGGSGAPLDTSIIRDILTQETALRIQLQKNVDTLMKEFAALKESTTNEISSLKQEIADLKTENTELRHNFDLLNSSCNQGCPNHGSPVAVSGDASSSVSDLKTQVRYLTLSLLDLQKQSSVLNDTLEQNFRSVSANLNTSIQDMKTALGRTERQQADLMNSVSTLEKNITFLIKSQVPKVGFTASMTSIDMSTTNGRRLVFPHVIVNEGRGYNPSDGVFTAPVGGLYVFYSSLQSYNNEYYHCDIALNGSIKVRVYTWATDDTWDQSASNMAVLRLQKGDRVWMKMSTASRIGSDAASVSTFTGYLIHL